MNLLADIVLCITLLMPLAAQAQHVAAKDPFSYSLRIYGLMLATAILGGFVSWYGKVRRGEISPGSVFHLIGEITTSAFVGLVVFWACEYLNLPQLVTAPIVGVAGHLGAKAITWIERVAQSGIENKTGVKLEGVAGDQQPQS